MQLKQGIRTGTARIKTKTSTAITIAGVAIIALGSSLGVFPAFADASSQNVVYNNIPSPKPSNVPSVGYEATQTKEFGSQIGLDGSARKDPKVTVLMSSWACKSGTWFGLNCITNPGSTFTQQITLNVYNVGSGDSVGGLIASKTQTFSMPYRPTADDGTNCNGSNAGKWWDGTNCNNGKAFKIDFDFNGTTLPDNVIIGVGYNTSHYGNSPAGESAACYTTPQGCPYDSLNVGTNAEPTVGDSLPSDDAVYWNTLNGSSYTGGGVGDTFRLDTGWAGYLPAIEVEASSGHGQNGGHHGRNGHHEEHHEGKDRNNRGLYNTLRR